MRFFQIVGIFSFIILDIRLTSKVLHIPAILVIYWVIFKCGKHLMSFKERYRKH